MQPLSQYLRSRLLVHQCTNESLLNAYSHSSHSAYLGIDPTAPSLHVGHLMGLLTLKRLKTFGGYKPIVLIGGATALIGDPSFKVNERPLLTPEFVSSNIASIESMLRPLLGEDDVLFVNNRDFYGDGMTALNLLRDVGRHFRVSTMLSRETVKSRLDSGDGLSFTELSYQLLQAHDFRLLFEKHQCRVQVGGSDQFGNILSGVDYIERTKPASMDKRVSTVGLTFPLVTVGGVKLGKTSGNVTCWLDRQLTSDFDFFQYFMKLGDEDAQKMLLMLTEDTHDLDDVRPQLRVARSVTSFVRGKQASQQAERLSDMLFGEANPTDLVACAESAGVFPTCISREEQDMLTIFQLALKTKICASISEAKKLAQSGGLYVNGRKWNPQLRHIPHEWYSHDHHVLLLRAGKSNWGIVRVKN